MTLKVMRKTDRTVPMICCDVCGSWIDDVGLAAAVFKSLSDEGECQEVHLVHKGGCHDTVEARLREGGNSVGWHELGRFLADLSHNSGLTLERLQKLEADDETFGRL